jgi:glycosyltransferase involved in cell wall biosynthesis
MKRIGIDAHVLTGKYQGSRTYLENILREIGRQDTENHYLIYSHAPEETRVLLPYENFEHVRIGIRNGIARLLFYWPWAQSCHRLDFLLTQYIGPPFYQGKQFLIIHDLLFESHPQFFPWLMRFRLKLFCRHSASQAQAVFTVSEYSRHEIIHRYGVPDERVMLTPNGAPLIMGSKEESEVEIASLQPYLLYVGRLELRKNIDLLVQAFRKAKSKDLKLIIVGREDFGCRKIAARLSAEPGIIHLRDVNSLKLGNLYRHATGFVFPSLGEGFGLPVLEAISYGTPVIASNQTAIPEVGGSLARYFDPTAADAEGQLASQIENLSNHSYRLSDSLVREHIAKFSWEGSARIIVNAIDRF